MRILVFIFLIGLPAANYAVEIDRHTPDTAKTRGEIIAAAEKIKGFGIIEWAEFRQQGQHLLVISYDPFLGRAATYVHLYHHDGDQWIRFGEKLIEGTNAVSAEMPIGKQELILRGSNGKVVLTESFAKIK